MGRSSVVVRVWLTATAAAACALLALCTTQLGGVLADELPVPLTTLAGDASTPSVAGGR